MVAIGSRLTFCSTGSGVPYFQRVRHVVMD
jgi:hypothetical protein